jgi:uncharacterized protein
MHDAASFAHRYIAVWNSGEAQQRRALVNALWSVDALELTESSRHSGQDAIFKRITEAYESFVADGHHRFVLHGPVGSHHDAITFTTTMIATVTSEVVWTGLVFALLDDDGRVRTDYQFALT